MHAHLLGAERELPLPNWGAALRRPKASPVCVRRRHTDAVLQKRGEDQALRDTGPPPNSRITPSRGLVMPLNSTTKAHP